MRHARWSLLFGAAARASILALSAAAAPFAAAQQAPPSPEVVLVTLTTGETLRGALIERSADFVTIEHPALGTVKIAAAKVTGVVTAPPLPGEPAPGAVAPPADAPAPPPSPAAISQADMTVTPPAPPKPPEPAVKWAGFVSGGINGSEGNTEQMSLRFETGISRTTKDGEASARGSWRYKTENGDKTQNEVFLKERYEWFFSPTPWLFFVEANQEFNEFKDYNWRIDFLAGPGYKFIDNDRTKLTGRVGAGAAKEFGGADEDWYPIALASLDFTHKITERVFFSAYGEYKPDLGDFDNFQLLGRAGIDIALNDSKTLFLKLGIEDRYDNDPGPGTESNDIDYFLLVAYTF